MYRNNQCVPSVGHHSLDPAQPALVSVGPLSVVVQVDMSLKSNLTYTLLTKKKHQNVNCEVKCSVAFLVKCAVLQMKL